jgi:hypothetical protein
MLPWLDHLALDNCISYTLEHIFWRMSCSMTYTPSIYLLLSSTDIIMHQSCLNRIWEVNVLHWRTKEQIFCGKPYSSSVLCAAEEAYWQKLPSVSIQFQRRFFAAQTETHPCWKLLCDITMKIRPWLDEYTELGCKNLEPDTKGFETSKTSNS